jgi:hypothetical protein
MDEFIWLPQCPRWWKKLLKSTTTTQTEFPENTLKKNEGKIVDMKACRSIVGKIMYYTTKIAPELSNAVREL